MQYVKRLTTFLLGVNFIDRFIPMKSNQHYKKDFCLVYGRFSAARAIAYTVQLACGLFLVWAFAIDL